MAHREKREDSNPGDTHPNNIFSDGSKTNRVQFPEGSKPSSTGVQNTEGEENLRFALRQDSELNSHSLGTDDGEDSSEYDWSAEEDLVDEAAKFESQMGKKGKRKAWSFKRLVLLLFTSLIGSVVLAGVIVTPTLIVHFYWYKPHPTPERQFIKDNVEAWLFWAASNLIISWFLAMIIDIIPILVQFFLSATWGHVSESIKTRIETYDSVKNTAKPAFYAGSAYASWTIIFGGIYRLYNIIDPDNSRAEYTNRMAEVVQFFFFLILVWCVKRMLSHFIAFSFHRSAYKERIEAVEKALSVIEQLRQYRPKPQAAHHYNKSSGGRTPVHGGHGFVSDKQHFKALSGALKNASRSALGKNAAIDEDHDGDVEDHDRRLVNPISKPGNRFSWFTKTKKQNHPSAIHANELIDKLDKKTWTPEDDSRPVTPYKGAIPSHQRQLSDHAIQTQARQVPDPGLLTAHQYPASRRNTSRPSSVVDNSNNGTTANSDLRLKQVAKMFKHAVLHDARNLSGQSGGGLAWNVNSAHEAKRLARSIFMRFKVPGRTWLTPSDFYPAYNDPSAAQDAFKVFDKDNNGDISRAEVKTTLLKVYKERRFLSRSMRDVSQALSTLDRILMFFAVVVVFFISLSVFGVQISASLTSIYSLGIAASFLFKNSASSAFDAIMFLFVMHPYDTGDRVFVDQENLVVKKVGLFATVFQRFDGTETYYFNSQLFNKFIINVRRSGKTWENLTMQVAWTTPLTKLDTLEKCINEWLSTEENRWFEPSTNITLQHVKYQRYLELTIGIGHNGNWQDWNLRQTRKTAFHAAVQYYCREVGIIGWEAPIPIVYADPKTMTYRPPQPRTNDFDDDMSSPIVADPANPGGSPEQQHVSKEEAIEDEKTANEMKPTLGFLPPLAVRSSRLMRARKSRHRKANLGAGNM